MITILFYTKSQSLKFTSAVSKWSHSVDKDKDLKIWVSFDWPSYILYSSNPEFVKNVFAQVTVMITYAVNRTDPSKQAMRLIFKKKIQCGDSTNESLDEYNNSENTATQVRSSEQFWEWIDLIHYFPVSPKHYQQLAL